jgi:hypothetical protein
VPLLPSNHATLTTPPPPPLPNQARAVAAAAATRPPPSPPPSFSRCGGCGGECCDAPPAPPARSRLAPSTRSARGRRRAAPAAPAAATLAAWAVRGRPPAAEPPRPTQPAGEGYLGRPWGRGRPPTGLRDKGVGGGMMPVGAESQSRFDHDSRPGPRRLPTRNARTRRRASAPGRESPRSACRPWLGSGLRPGRSESLRSRARGTVRLAEISRRRPSPRRGLSSQASVSAAGAEPCPKASHSVRVHRRPAWLGAG